MLMKRELSPQAILAVKPTCTARGRGFEAARLSSIKPPRVGPTESEQAVLRLRRSLYVVADVRAGDSVTRENVRSIRPSGGLATDQIEVALGRTFGVGVSRGTPLTWDLI